MALCFTIDVRYMSFGEYKMIIYISLGTQLLT